MVNGGARGKGGGGAAAGACSYSLMEPYCGLLEVLTELVCGCENRCVNNPQKCSGGETQNHLMYSGGTETAVLLHSGPRLQFSHSLLCIWLKLQCFVVASRHRDIRRVF